MIAGSFGVGTSFVPGLVVWRNGHRSECNTVPIFSEGLLFQQGYACSCPYALRGQLMEVSAGDFEFGRRAKESTRLRISAKNVATRPVASSDLDWPAFRADNARNGSNRSAVIPAASLVWTAKSAAIYPLPSDAFKTSDPVYAPTPPVCVGDRIFAGNADGSVRCLQLGDGRELWRFHTSARLFASPTWNNGRLYVGSGDGYVYCLDAANGRELWRFQAAPVERRIFVEGHLISSWPITGSVIVEDGVAYVWACLLNRDGAHVYALDAQTGVIRWQNNDSGAEPEGAVVFRRHHYRTGNDRRWPAMDSQPLLRPARRRLRGAEYAKRRHQRPVYRGAGSGYRRSPAACGTSAISTNPRRHG